jgi:hypothetical protein
MTPHDYISTGCLHGQHGSCRLTCKFCDARCQCPCDHQALSPGSWVDQARGIARQLLAVTTETGDVPAELVMRIALDPSLFWLRDGEVPPGERAPG